ncbi:hypothetical protein FNV43_RR23705 [Rhamnella rubrinervis]|uniref:Ribosomal protein eL8/eL30/eS12/Gadd45 domain-containing protein n=1 Tax=Rhamnella rubrinervis TaxID=2594499 RepID=A0A8K0DWM5_9ROSA|nr:hypothetical protein FNV43_RR23705 [Rhamnella rubrinervis]
MASRSRAPINHGTASSFLPQDHNCYEGQRLACLLQLINKTIDSARHSDWKSLPEKIWLKQQLSIGVNEVTRVLERMTTCDDQESSLASDNRRKSSSVQLQVVLVASDCNSRWLTKHLPSLASSRKVPLIFVKDKKGASLRLGELVKLKTAIAIGVKAKGTSINQLFVELLRGNSLQQVDDLINLERLPLLK